MNQTYLQALGGLLKSVSDSSAVNVQFVNNTDMTVQVFWLNYSGERVSYGTIAPHSTLNMNTFVTHGWLFAANATGGFLCAYQIVANTTAYPINYSALVAPNDIGPPPQRTGTMLIPPDGPRILIEAALAANGVLVQREQYWRMANSSYSLAVGESKVIQYVTRTGVEQTSSSQSTIAAELGASVTAGWGPVSASISASLSTTSTTSRGFTVTQQQSVDVVTELDNTTQSDITVFQWQLIDEVTVVKNGQAVASLAVAQAPEIHQTAV